MARKKVVKADEEIEQLRDLVDHNGDGVDATASKSSRRGLLKMAGAALAGAAGAAALRAIPAAAATGSAVLQGCYNFESVDQPTYLIGAPSAANTEAGTAFIARSSTGIRGAGYWPADHSAEVGLFGISKGDNLNATTGGAGTGVVGLSNTGRGNVGVSSSGAALMGVSGTGYDAQLGFSVIGGQVGSGRLAMIGRTDVGGVGPSWGPTFQVTSTGSFTFQHELIRGNDSSIWASRFDASSTPNSTRWKRINAVRVDSADGTGANFKPKRVIDTRTTPSAPTTGGKPSANTLHVVTVAGVGTLASHIPGDAIAVMGNLTAVSWNGPGFLAIMPAGITVGTGAGQYNPNADPSSLNFLPGQTALANSFVCGLHNGQLQVYVGDVASHFIIDITAYLQ